MASIRAVVVDTGSPDRLVLREVEPPVPHFSEALIRVAAVSLNLGEVRIGLTSDQNDWRPGWDLAGTVEQAAADGSGPPAGAQVVGILRQGAWAEQVVAPADRLAVLPDTVPFAEAATLPVAGLTALYALERGRLPLAQPVLITGASGGVGHFACQLARHAGARVVAQVRRPEREAAAREAGAHEVIVGEDLSPASAFGPYPLILESVGGAALTTALSLLAEDGVCVSYGTSAGSSVTFDAAQFFLIGGASLYGFILAHEFRRMPASEGLARLAAMVADRRLRPHIEVEAPWTEIAAVARRLMDRQIAGKAVLRVSG